ncbi:MAG: hypothetical protein II180_03460 [Proteobacteria bacterium]|nr:hypothetical protein [Pseudomonadota bacterium]
MMKRFLAAILACAVFALPIQAFAKQSYDFSDIVAPSLKLPFNVTNVEISGEFFTTTHIYHVSDSYDSVIKKLFDMYEKKEKISGFSVMGVTQQTQMEAYQLVLGYQNEHHYVLISPEGSGTVLSYEAMPSSYQTGVYDAVGYGFILSDGSTSNLYIGREE